MLSDEEKKAIEGIKKDDEYYDILENIKQNKYNMLNVEKLMRDTTTGDYTEYEIAQSIVYFVNLIEKQSKEIEEYKECERLSKRQLEKQKNDIETLKIEIEELKEDSCCMTNCVKRDKEKIFLENKIKAKIEELEKLDFGTDLVSQFTANLTTITILRSLLEKE